MLLTLAKNHYSHPILDNGISSFCHLYNDNSDRNHQHYLSESSSPSLTDPNYLQNQVSNLDTTIEMEAKEPPTNHHLSKGYLLSMMILILH